MIESPRIPDPENENQGLFAASEWRQIIFILGLSTATLFAVALTYRHDQRLSVTLLSTIGMHAAGARAPAIVFCLSRGLSPLATLAYNFYIEILIVVLCYYTFVLVVREGIEHKLLHLAARRAEAAAQEHRSLLKRFELVGLFFLVVAPFPMTGPVTGALVGYLLNLKPWTTFFIVLSGTFVALSVYVALGRAVLGPIIDLQARYADEVSLAIIFLIGVFTIYHVRSIARWVSEAVDSFDKD